MRLYAKFFLSTAVLLISTGLWAQEVYHSLDADLFARLSYDRSAIVEGDDLRHICLAVLRDGSYRVERSLIAGTERLEGKLTKDQFEQLKKLLESEKFRALSGNNGRLIRQDAESFAAEIPLGERLDAYGIRQWQKDEAWRLQWLNGDGESPFPDSMAKVVDWLKHFDPKDGKSFVYAEYPDVCPSGGLRLVQPWVAENQKP